jgi:phage minor structural protein
VGVVILLNGHSLAAKRRILPESLGIVISEREGTATMVPDSMDGIGIKSWFLDDTEPGKGIIYRVKSLGNDFANQTPTVEMEHIVNTLKDRILFGEVKPADMGGGETCTARQAVQYILARSDEWTLGNFDYGSVSLPYKFNGENLYDALVSVTKSLEDAWWSYDLTAIPFKLNITRRSESVWTELRCGRNIASVTRNTDVANMYTRFYPVGKDDLHISGNYVERNAGDYGVREQVEVNTGLETEEELRRWANEKLDVHAQPLDTVEVEALELADATGESLDKIRIGRICRVPLPEYGTIIEERITQVRYSDKLNRKEEAQVTLANAQEDIAKIIADAIKEGAGPRGGGGRRQAEQDKEDHAWFEDTDEHVAMCAVGIIGTDEHGNPNWTRLSRLEVNENGIFGEVQSVLHDMVVANTRIDQNENEIRLEANRAISKENSLSSRISVQADQIGLVVEKKNGKNVVKSASIITAINQDGSSIKLSADKINLSGYVTMSKFTSLDGTVQNLKAGNFTGIGIRCGSLSINSAQFTLGVNVVWKSTIKDGDGNTVNVLKWG